MNNTTVQEQQIEKRENAREEWYLDGVTDASFGYLPRFQNEAYLSGYVAGIKQLPSVDGRIDYGVKVGSGDEF